MKWLTNESRYNEMINEQEMFIDEWSPRTESGRVVKTREQVLCDVKLLEGEAINSDAFSSAEWRHFCTRVVHFVMRHERLITGGDEYSVIRGRLKSLILNMQEVVDGHVGCMGADRSNVILGRLFAWCLIRLDEANWRHNVLSPKDVEMLDADIAVVC